MAMLSSPSGRLARKARSLRFRAGIATTFGSFFAVLCGLLVLPGILFLHDAVSHPMTADSAQLLMGSACISIALLLAIFLVRERR